MSTEPSHLINGALFTLGMAAGLQPLLYCFLNVAAEAATYKDYL